MNAEEIAERARKIAWEVAAKAGEDDNGKVFCKTYSRIVHYLMRTRPIVAILRRNNVAQFVGPNKKRGFQVIIRDEDPDLVAHIEESYGKSMESGSILMPIGFGEYMNRLKAVSEYQMVLAADGGIRSEIITIEYSRSEENHTALYVP